MWWCSRVHIEIFSVLSQPISWQYDVNTAWMSLGGRSGMYSLHSIWWSHAWLKHHSVFPQRWAHRPAVTHAAVTSRQRVTQAAAERHAVSSCLSERFTLLPGFRDQGVYRTDLVPPVALIICRADWCKDPESHRTSADACMTPASTILFLSVWDCREINI